MNEYLELKQKDFNKALDFFRREISSLRTGRINPEILHDVTVFAYEIENPLNAVANISLSDTSSILIVPWDKGVLKSIEKAIIEAKLGFGVVNEGDKIRLSLSPLTEENRKELVRKLNEKMEKTRIILRQARDNVKGSIEKDYEDKKISEDDKFRFIKELDEFSAEQNIKLKGIKDKKEKDIMEI